jgi:succinoglycan biosynthesis transport protein ExoP
MMLDLPDEQVSEQPDFRRYLNIARRRQLQFVLPLFVGWLLVWGSSWILKPHYKSSTLILVEEPTMPRDYVAPNVSNDLQDRLQSITQQILSRTRLLSIIQQMHLYQDSGSAATNDDELVERMRKDINIELARDARNNQITAFRIFYTASDPHVAQAVTSSLKDLFINETLRVRQVESQDTTRFIEDQLKDASAQLTAQEEKVHAYQSTHEGALPEQAASNLQILSGLQSQLQNAQDALNAARQQRVLMQSQVEQYKTAKDTMRSPETLPVGVAALDAQLTALRAQLVDLSARYTDSYPDVKKIKGQIAETQRQRDQMASAEKRAAGSGGFSDAPPGSPQAQLESQLQANKLEITNREQEISGLQVRISGYEGRLNATPSTEQELAELTRGLDQSKANYDDLLKKKNSSVMATSMEQLQQGERFTLLDPPSLPAKPDFPNHLKFCVMGLGVGFGLGLVVAGAFELIDDRLHSEKEIKNLLPVSVISEIPDVVSTVDEANNKRKLILNWAATAAVFVVILAAAAISYLHS